MQSKFAPRLFIDLVGDIGYRHPNRDLSGLVSYISEEYHKVIVKELKEALEFYATGFDKKLTNSMMGVNTPALLDGGKRARLALDNLNSQYEKNRP
jgi:hypothetical protein